VLNSPVNYTDPTGQIVPLIALGVAALGYILLSPGTGNAPRICDKTQGGDPNAAMIANIAIAETVAAGFI